MKDDLALGNDLASANGSRRVQGVIQNANAPIEFLPADASMIHV